MLDLLLRLLNIVFLSVMVLSSVNYDLDTDNQSYSNCGCGSDLSREGPSEVNSEGSFRSKISKTDETFSPENDIISNAVKISQSFEKNCTEDMVYIYQSDSSIGSDDPVILSDGEGPKRYTTLSSYYIDKYEVSNNEFKKFINETGYVTESEMFGWSFVFHSAIPKNIKAGITQAVLGSEWWLPVNGSYWEEPGGPGTNVFDKNQLNYPVVQVSWNDALKYCEWRNARLPTEAEWEHAARGGMNEGENIFPWGDDLIIDNQHQINIFQGVFPNHNTGEDGYEFLARVDSFPPNRYGIHNMLGNVWEWVSDWHTTQHDRSASRKKRLTPLIDPKGPSVGTDKVKKGGSFLCHISFCYRYRVEARFPSTPDSATYNIGFRCAKDATA